jgi:flavin reductase (DIM6/NTAB) family NADH-FMN oxidoreductase RutF
VSDTQARGELGDPPESVHELIDELDYPMFIVTVAASGDRAGCLVGFATQCSIGPPRFLVCISDKNRTYRTAHDAEVMVVHLVPDDATDLAELFGAETGDEVDKFERCRWRPGPADTPILEDCGNWFAGRILDRMEAGDHRAFLLEPFEAASDPREGSFAFHRAKRMEPGHRA